MNNFLNYSFWGNTVDKYILSASIIIAIFLAQRIVKHFVKKKFVTNTLAVDIINKFLLPFLFLFSLFIILDIIELPAKILKWTNYLVVVAVFWYSFRFITFFFNRLINVVVENRKEDSEGFKKVKPLVSFANFFIWILGVLLLLNYFGFNISAIVAGLGISGIAVALAAQALLKDLFSYFIIFFDRPFHVGDFLTFDKESGTVEKIGIKSTQIRALNGEIIVVSNSNLTDTKVHNFKRMEKRRVVFNFGVIYQTDLKLLKEIPSIVKEVVSESHHTTFERSHFKSYGASSLDYENVFYILSADYNLFMDIQHQINLRLFEEFQKRSIQFAYPTQTIFLEHDIPPARKSE